MNLEVIKLCFHFVPLSYMPVTVKILEYAADYYVYLTLAVPVRQVMGISCNLFSFPLFTDMTDHFAMVTIVTSQSILQNCADAAVMCNHRCYK